MSKSKVRIVFHFLGAFFLFAAASLLAAATVFPWWLHYKDTKTNVNYDYGLHHYCKSNSTSSDKAPDWIECVRPYDIQREQVVDRNLDIMKYGFLKTTFALTLVCLVFDIVAFLCACVAICARQKCTSRAIAATWIVCCLVALSCNSAVEVYFLLKTNQLVSSKSKYSDNSLYKGSCYFYTCGAAASTLAGLLAGCISMCLVEE